MLESRTRLLRIATLWIGALLFIACSPEDQRRALEGRLLAPCCWRQSLRDHDSELATSLKTEIAGRLAAGEVPTLIENDLVQRYGERIRALPGGSDPSWLAATVPSVFSVLALAGLFVWGRRRRREPSCEPATRRDLDRYNDRLDDELALID